MNPPILEEDFKTLVNKLHPVQAKWKSLGIALKMQCYDLDAIEQNAGSSGVQQMLVNMLNQWLLSDQTRTWPEIVTALDSPTVGHTGLAKEIRDEYCRDYLLPSEPPPRPISQSSSTESDKRPRPCDKRTAAVLLGVISLCVGFAFGGITLMAVGIRGLAEDEDYLCSLGPTDVFNSLNLITGFVFLSGLVILIFYIFYFFLEHIRLAKKIMTVTIIAAIATSLVFLIGDMIYSFYVASELLPVVERWEGNKTLCHEAIFRSSFGVIVTYFLLICILIVIGAVIISRWVYKKIKDKLIRI